MRTDSGRHFVVFVAIVLLTAGLLFAAGCDDDPVATVSGGTVAVPQANSKTQLMKNLRKCYSEMWIDPFVDLLSPDYKMFPISSILNLWDWDEAFYFDNTDAVTIHTNLFGGVPGVTHRGDLIFAIDAVVVEMLEQVGDWNGIPEDDLYFGGHDGEFSKYQVRIQFWNAANAHKFDVQQEVVFYVTQVMVDGSTLYQLLGIRALAPEGKSTDEASWCSVLALFQQEAPIS